jgi:hypothetical protein
MQPQLRTAIDPGPARLRLEPQQTLAQVAAGPRFIGIGPQLAGQQFARLRPGQCQPRGDERGQPVERPCRAVRRHQLRRAVQPKSPCRLGCCIRRHRPVIDHR